MKPLLLLLGALLVFGCGHRPEAGAQQKESARYQGRTAAEWAKDLADKDGAASSKAAVALCAIGNDASPYLLAGLENKDTRTTLLSIMETHAVAAKEPALLRAVSKIMTADSDPDYRILAARACYGFGPTALPALRAALTAERNHRVRPFIESVIRGLDPSKE